MTKTRHDALLKDVLFRAYKFTPIHRYPLNYGEDGMTIIASPLMPQFGLLLANKSGGQNRWKIAFNTTEEEAKSTWFAFKCMCCCPGLSDSRTIEFKRTLEERCKNNDITTLFVRNARSWDDRPFSPFNGVKLVEACRMRLIMDEATSEKEVDYAWVCISWKYSQLTPQNLLYS